MSGYFETYGVAEARRLRIIKIIVISVVAVFTVSGLLYWKFKDYKEEKQLALFFDRLKAGDYKGAHALWGCTDEKPCRDYNFDRFMEDWGPKSDAADLSSLKVSKVRSCNAGIIEKADFGPGRSALLWVQRQDLTVGFAPWPVCNPKLPKE